MAIINAANASLFIDQIKQGKLWMLDIKHVRAVGHLVGELDCWFLEMKLGLRPEVPIVVLAPEEVCEHRHFLTYVMDTKLAHVATDSRLCAYLRNLFFSLGYVISAYEYWMTEKRASIWHQLHFLNRNNSFFGCIATRPVKISSRRYRG